MDRWSAASSRWVAGLDDDDDGRPTGETKGREDLMCALGRTGREDEGVGQV